jgi:hypothetical protein
MGRRSDEAIELVVHGCEKNCVGVILSQTMQDADTAGGGLSHCFGIGMLS